MKRLSLAQRLLLINTMLIVLMISAAATVWLMMANLSDTVVHIKKKNVPQLIQINELELNVTRVSLQIRHAMLAQDKNEFNYAIKAIADLRVLINKQLDDGVIYGDDRDTLEQLPGLMNTFWKQGEANIALIRAGKHDEAFSFLVEQTVPARNALLSLLASEKNRNRESLSGGINDIQSLSEFNRIIVIGSVLFVVMGLMALSLYLRYVTRQLGGDPLEITRIADAVASGDLSMQVQLNAGDTQSAMAHILSMTQCLADSVHAVRVGAEIVANASAEIAQGNTELSMRTEQQASSVEEISASTEQLSGAVSLNAENSRAASDLASSASALAIQGGDVMKKVVSTMYDISHSSNKIADIIGTIDSIAFQTNLLALNAAVEAARAGEQGRGFAVVAGEVRNLAQRSAEAAKQIKELISASTERVEQGSQLVELAGSTMSEIVNAIGQVTSIMGEISTSSAEQSTGVKQVGTAMALVDQATQQNAALVEQIAAAASTLQSQASDLVSSVAIFKFAENAGNSYSQFETKSNRTGFYVE